MSEKLEPTYGVGDATFQAVGGEEGIRKLVDSFYDVMEAQSAYQTIRSLHNPDLEVARDKLSRFLCGWMGGPRRYSEKYGKISIPGVHAHLRVTEVERDQWLACMAEALAQQAYPADLVTYLQTELAVPAERIRQHSTALHRTK